MSDETPATPALKIVEGIAGVWFYHLSVTGKNLQPTLCGKTKEVMSTEIPLSAWDSGPGNVGARWCRACNEKYRATPPPAPESGQTKETT